MATKKKTLQRSKFKIFLQNQISFRSRQDKLDIFIRTLKPTAQSTILDVGVKAIEHREYDNFLEKYYPYKEKITAVGIQDVTTLKGKYPEVDFIQADGRALPFEDDQFDIVYSNAVVEHVGEKDNQAAFIKELVRVSKKVFVTTPNRHFPFELHTQLPLVHYLPRRIHRKILKRSVGQEFWAAAENLNLLSARQFRNLFPQGVKVRIIKQRKPLLVSHNLIAIAEKV